MSLWLEVVHDVNVSQGITQVVYLNADTVVQYGFMKINVSLGVDKWVILADGLQLVGDYSSVQDALDTLQDLTEGQTLADHLS